MFFFFIIVVYEYETGLYCVFIEWCGDKIKEMFVGKTENACGFVLDADANQLPLIIPFVFPFRISIYRFPPGDPDIGV